MKIVGVGSENVRGHENSPKFIRSEILVSTLALILQQSIRLSELNLSPFYTYALFATVWRKIQKNRFLKRKDKKLILQLQGRF